MAAKGSGAIRRAGRVLAGGALLAVLGARSVPARAQEAAGGSRPIVEMVPSLIELGGAPLVVEIRLRNAPAIAAFRIEIEYDAAAALVTAVEPGAYLSSAAGPGRISLRGAEPGRLTLTGEISAVTPTPAPEGTPDPDAAGAEDPSTFIDDVDPGALTEGPLALVTFAALARTESPGEVTIAAVELTDAEGATIAADAPSAQLFVGEDPSPEAKAEAERQAGVLGEESAGGLAGMQDTIVRSFRRVRQRAAAFEIGPELAWFAILAAALGVVWVGWHFGRRPARYEGPSA